MNQFLLRQLALLQNEAGGAGGEGGAGAGAGDQGGAGSQGGNANTIDLSHPDVQKAINEATAGLKTKQEELLGKIKGYQQTLKGYKGKSPEEIQAILDGVQDAEEKDLIAQGKFDEVFSRRTERMASAHQSTVQEFETKLAEANGRIEKLSANTVASAVKSAAAEAGALPQALNDFVSRAHNVFALNDNFEVVAVDKEGNILLDSDGKTPLSPLAWAKALKSEAPHLFAIGNGGGSQGGQGGKGTIGKVDGTPEERTAYFASRYNLPNK